MRYQEYELAEIKLPKLDGFKYTGEYRVPSYGEWVLSGGRPKKLRSHIHINRKHILKNIKVL